MRGGRNAALRAEVTSIEGRWALVALTVFVVSHGNTLRALVKHLERVDDEASAKLEVPNGVPLLYELDADLRPLGGRRPLG